MEERLALLKRALDQATTVAGRSGAGGADRRAARALERIPYLDPIDLRYRSRVRVPVPTSKAVMFCLMDVSGSMDEGARSCPSASSSCCTCS
jgi:uncharacterized sporulation protein YeaH/YhbH (DUF444 family)